MIAAYVAENKQVFEDAVKKFFDDNRMLLMVMAQLQTQLSYMGNQMVTEIVQRIKQGY